MAHTPATVLCPTPPDRLVDAAGRPYFLWDTAGVDLAALRERLADPDATVRGYWMGKVLRQAKPDDALTFVSWRQIDESWPLLEPHLGRSRAFWAWFLRAWRQAHDARR